MLSLEQHLFPAAKVVRNFLAQSGDGCVELLRGLNAAAEVSCDRDADEAVAVGQADGVELVLAVGAGAAPVVGALAAGAVACGDGRAGAIELRGEIWSYESSIPLIVSDEVLVKGYSGLILKVDKESKS